MLTIIFLALAVSLDAFAVAIGLGAKQKNNPQSLALNAAIYFGFCHGLMTAFGYLGGRGVLSWTEQWAPWIASVLLLIIGGKMIVDSFSEGVEEEFKKISRRVLLVLGIVTSVDDMLAGVSLVFMSVHPFIACSLIAFTTAILSYCGIYLGAKTGTKLENKAELLGGLILMAIGVKILLG
jgi:manganese efflux pump family protein